MISKNPNITRLLIEYREMILSLEGQAAELSDREAAYEQAEMLWSRNLLRTRSY